MKDASAKASPFAALNRQEQNEMWICWQCQQPAAADDKPVTSIESQPLPDLKLPQRAPAATAAIRHGQYDAVLRRMERAGKRTGGFQNWNA